jgi:hypothetical protein
MRYSTNSNFKDKGENCTVTLRKRPGRCSVAFSSVIHLRRLLTNSSSKVSGVHAQVKYKYIYNYNKSLQIPSNS